MVEAANWGSDRTKPAAGGVNEEGEDVTLKKEP
jgi:hypothetical protein